MEAGTASMPLTIYTVGHSQFSVNVRIDTPNELDYFLHGGILSYVLRQTLK